MATTATMEVASTSWPRNRDMVEVTSDDEDIIGGVPIQEKPRIPPAAFWQAERQPRLPPLEEFLHLKNFASFIKKHSSPTHKRVTAGGKIVPAGPNGPQVTFRPDFLESIAGDTETPTNQLSPTRKSTAKPTVGALQMEVKWKPEGPEKPKLRFPPGYKVLEIFDGGKAAYVSVGNTLMRAKLTENGETAFETMHTASRGQQNTQDPAMMNGAFNMPYPQFIQAQPMPYLLSYPGMVTYFPGGQNPALQSIVTVMGNGGPTPIQVQQPAFPGMTSTASLGDLHMQLDQCNRELKQTEKFSALHDLTMDDYDREKVNDRKRILVERQSALKAKVRQLESASNGYTNGTNANSLVCYTQNANAMYQMPSQALVAYDPNAAFQLTAARVVQQPPQETERQSSEETSVESKKRFSPNAPEFIPKTSSFGLGNEPSSQSTKVVQESVNTPTFDDFDVSRGELPDDSIKVTDENFERAWDRVSQDNSVAVSKMRYAKTRAASEKDPKSADEKTLYETGTTLYESCLGAQLHPDSARFNELLGHDDRSQDVQASSTTTGGGPKDELAVCKQEWDAVSNEKDANVGANEAWDAFQKAMARGDEAGAAKANELLTKYVELQTVLAKKNADYGKKAKAAYDAKMALRVQEDAAREGRPDPEAQRLWEEAARKLKSQQDSTSLLKSILSEHNSNHPEQIAIEATQYLASRQHVKPSTAKQSLTENSPQSVESKKKNDAPRNPFKAQSSISSPTIYAVGDMAKGTGRPQEQLVNIRGGGSMALRAQEDAAREGQGPDPEAQRLWEEAARKLKAQQDSTSLFRSHRDSADNMTSAEYHGADSYGSVQQPVVGSMTGSYSRPPSTKPAEKLRFGQAQSYHEPKLCANGDYLRYGQTQSYHDYSVAQLQPGQLQSYHDGQSGIGSRKTSVSQSSSNGFDWKYSGSRSTRVHTKPSHLIKKSDTPPPHIPGGPNGLHVPQHQVVPYYGPTPGYASSFGMQQNHQMPQGYAPMQYGHVPASRYVEPGYSAYNPYGPTYVSYPTQSGGHVSNPSQGYPPAAPRAMRPNNVPLPQQAQVPRPTIEDLDRELAKPPKMPAWMHKSSQTYQGCTPSYSHM